MTKSFKKFSEKYTDFENVSFEKLSPFELHVAENGKIQTDETIKGWYCNSSQTYLVEPANYPEIYPLISLKPVDIMLGDIDGFSETDFASLIPLAISSQEINGGDDEGLKNTQEVTDDSLVTGLSFSRDNRIRGDNLGALYDCQCYVLNDVNGDFIPFEKLTHSDSNFMESFKEYLVDKKGKNALTEKKEVLSEASLGRFYQHYSKGDPIAIVSAFTQDASRSENVRKTAQLRQAVLASKFAYNRAIGGYTYKEGNETKEVDSELSTIIYGTPEREDELKKFAIKLGTRFKQECVLFIDTSKKTYLIFTKKSGDKNVGDSNPLGDFTTKILSDYTKIKRKYFAFKSLEKEGKEIGAKNLQESDYHQATSARKVFEELRKDYDSDHDYDKYFESVMDVCQG